jgi:PKD repeat protein
VSNTSNISDISCKEIAIATTSINNCKANFNFNVDSLDKIAIFSDASLGSPDKWEWDFGDKKASTDTNPSHTYSAAGYYLVSLKISTSSGCSDKTYKLLDVSLYNVGLKVAFGFDKGPTSSKAGGYPVDFIGAGLGDQSRLKWNFGDGTTDTTSTTPSHVYTQNGIYHVCYTVSDPVTGDTAQYCDTVSITSLTDVKATANLQFSMNVFPNPFDGYTNIEYSLAKDGNIEIAAYDLNGRRLATIINGTRPAGTQTITWNTVGLSNGVYYLQLRTLDGNVSTKMVVKK